MRDEVFVEVPTVAGRVRGDVVASRPAGAQNCSWRPLGGSKCAD